MTEPSENQEKQPPNDAEQLEIKLPGEAVSPKEIGLWAGVLALLVLVVYWPATGGAFLWRDNHAASSPEFVGPGGLSRIWQQRWELPGAFTQPAYQPVALTAYWLEYQLGGHDSQSIPTPMAYHIGALVCLAASAILLWLLLRELKIPGSWLIAAIFALHPLHAEPVSWISEQAIVLAGLFFIASIYCYVMFVHWMDRDRAERAQGKPGVDPAQTWGFFAGSIVLCLLAMLSHPAATVLPAVILLLLWWRKRSTNLDTAVLVGLLLVGAGLWLKNTDLHRPSEASLLSAGFTSQLLAVGEAMLQSAVQLIAPFWLSIFHGQSMMGWAGLIAGALAVVGAYLAQPKFGRGPAAMLTMFFLLAAASVNWFDPTRISYVTDASAYLTMLPLVILIIAGAAAPIERTKPKGPAMVVGISAALLIALGVPAWMRAHVFANSISLWTDTLKHHPDSVLAESSLAQSYREQARTDVLDLGKEAVDADYQQAEDHANAALKLDPRNALAEGILAEIHVDRGDDAGALPHFENAARLDPHNARILTEHGSALVLLDRYGQAIDVLDRSLASDSSSGATHRLLGKAYFGLKNYDRAAKEEQLALDIDPADSAARELLGDAQDKLGQTEDAVKTYGQILTDPVQRNRYDIWMKIARLKDRQGDYDIAVEYMDAARKLADSAVKQAQAAGASDEDQKPAKEKLRAIETELTAEKIKQQKAAATRPSSRSTTAPAPAAAK